MLVIAISAFVGCKSAPQNTPTAPAASAAPVTSNVGERPDIIAYGSVTAIVKKGITTQAQLIELFGGPNIATLDAEGAETWVYERNATRSQEHALVNWAESIQVSERGSKTLTVIFKFNQDKTVKDYSVRASSF